MDYSDCLWTLVCDHAKTCGNFQGFRIRKLIFHDFFSNKNLLKYQHAFIFMHSMPSFSKTRVKKMNITEMKCKAQLILLPADTTFTQVKHTGWLCLHSNRPQQKKQELRQKTGSFICRSPTFRDCRRRDTSKGATAGRLTVSSLWHWQLTVCCSCFTSTLYSTCKHRNTCHLLHFNVMSADRALLLLHFNTVLHLQTQKHLSLAAF